MRLKRSTIVPGCFVLSLVACGSEVPSTATVISPVFGDPCRFETCSKHGACAEGDNGGPRCLCDVGYAGVACDSCEAGSHIDSKGRCAPDRKCDEQKLNPCGPSGSCDDKTGVIACHCDPAYEGPRCTLCKPGYGRDRFGDCLQLVLGPHRDAGTGTVDPVEDATTPAGPCTADSCRGHGQCDEVGGRADCTCEQGYVGAACAACAPGYLRDGHGRCTLGTACLSGSGELDFEGNSAFPTFEDNCVSRVAVNTRDLIITSLGGDGEVWACARNTLYGLDTAHVFVEAGIENSAELIFSGPVSRVTFDYGARTELALDVLGDGKVAHRLAASRRTHGSTSYGFDPPVTMLAFHSVNGATQQLAIDNVVYTAAVCE